MALIPPSWHIARLSLLGRPSRTLLCGLSVLLASTLVVAISCALETALANIDARMRTLIGEADVRVVHEHGAAFSVDALDRARALPQVQAASGRIGGAISLRRADGGTDALGRVRRATLQCRGADLETEVVFDQIKYAEGRAPANDTEIGIDALAARALGASVGTQLEVVHFGTPIVLQVSGIRDRPALGALQRPLGHLSRRVLADVVQSEGEVDLVSVVLEKGVNPSAWIEAHASTFEPPLKLEPTELSSSGLDRPAAGGRIAIAVATMLAFLCCAFIVTTAMTTALAEQQRLFAIARCIGANRTQLFVGQVTAGGILCLASGAIGVPVGVALTAIAVWWYSALLPAGVALSWTGIALAVGGSTAAGVGGALFPAWKASRVSPLEALAVHARAASPRGIVAAAFVGAACLLAQLLLLLVPDRDSRFWCYILIGLPLLHVGWFVLAVPILRTIARLCAPPLERVLVLPRGLLAGSLAATPWRFGLVAGALMVGVAILVSTWSNGAAILSDISERVRFGDAFAFKTSGFNQEEVERIRLLPGVQSSAAVGYLPVRVLGEQVIGIEGLSSPNVVCIGFDSQPFLAMNRLDWIAGDPKRAAQRLRDGDAVLVAKEFLLARGVTVGDRVQLGTPESSHSFEVVGVVGAAGLDVATQFFGIRSLYMDHAVSCVFMDFAAVQRCFGTREAYLVQIDMGEDAQDADEARLAEAVESAAPGAVFASGRGIRREIVRIGGLMMTISSLVAVVAMTLASLAAAGVIAAGVATRARELGVLQAVGAGRGTLRGLVLGESLLVGVAAAMVGTLFGLHLAWMGVRSYREMAGMELSFEVQPLVITAAWCAVCAVSLLAALPSVRRLLQHEPRELLSAGAGLAGRRRIHRREQPSAA